MAYYNGQIPTNPGYTSHLAPFGIAPPLAQASGGYLQTASSFPYSQPVYQPQYPASAYPQPIPGPGPQFYQQQPFAQQPTMYQTYPQPGLYPPQQGYTQPQYTHHVAHGVQTDAYGLPFVQGDITLQYQQTFRVEEKALSATRDSFVVRDMNGSLRYKVHGSFTIHEVKTMSDIHGQALLVMRESRLRIRDRLTIFTPSNVPLMTLQKTAPIQIGTKRVHGFVGAYPKGNPDIVITGTHNSTHFRIMNAQNQEVGTVRRRKYSLKNMLTDQDTYEVNVQGGSPALICMMAVALDEIYED